MYSLLKKIKTDKSQLPFPLPPSLSQPRPCNPPLLVQLPTSSVLSNVVQQPSFFFRHHRSNHPLSFLYHRPSPTTASSTVPFHSQPSPSSISATSTTSVSPFYRNHSSSHHKHTSNNRRQHRCFISAPLRKSSHLPSPLAPPASFHHNPSPATITPPATIETSQFNHRKITTHLPFLLLHSPSQPTTVTPTPATLSCR